MQLISSFSEGIKGSTAEGRIGGVEDCELAEVNDCTWQDVADELLCDNDGDATAILDGLIEFNSAVDWVVFTT